MRGSRRATLKTPVAKINREGAFRDLIWRFPDREFADATLTAPSPAICARCHAYHEEDHWHYDERRYRELREVPDVHVTLCPGCVRVERRLYEGEVRVKHHGHAVGADQLLHLIHNEEARERVNNPTARIALLEERGDEIYLLTTTQFLARRIGRELQKAYHGVLTVTPLPYERFTRVRWELGK